jgi:hypothetical protein
MVPVVTPGAPGYPRPEGTRPAAPRRSSEKGRELSAGRDADTVLEKDFEFEGLRGQLSDSDDSWEEDSTYSQLLSIRSLGSDGSSECHRQSFSL